MNKLPKILHYGIFLFVMGLLVGGLLSIVNSFTKPIIEQKELEKALVYLEVLVPDADRFSDATNQYGRLPSGLRKIFHGYDANDNLETIIYWTSTSGWEAGAIQVMTAIDVNTSIIINSAVISAVGQTPGYGTRILDHDFKTAGKNVSVYAELDVLQLDRDELLSYDIISGVTVSSKAVLYGVEIATKHFVGNVGG